MQGELLCEKKLKVTDMVIIPVPEGTRVNAEVAGTVRGPKINGTTKSIDYALFRADGTALLHIHGVITTEEGDLIYYEASGFLTPTEQEGRYNAKEAVTFQTASEKYAWLNTTLAVAEGYADITTGELYFKQFVPFQPRK